MGFLLTILGIIGGGAPASIVGTNGIVGTNEGPPCCWVDE